MEETIATAATEAALNLAEELAPICEVLTVGCNLLAVLVCAAGLCAGSLLGLALWRWLK